ncbi:reticulon-4-interacting protein 1 homolog, mitochondrial-like [Macrosteles quadrilineatus]|uniref:reticulon-4-interacting protein 1 homolog, mitochondrial-like n=1 Tax=Macrosteles quadrilineatus TaxID=74068 RepID=UPI0023E279EB|nr:reticulon-4-interacting protein 1 homolog, mitochondrial-like [Macrosteles quadrilineatus]
MSVLIRLFLRNNQKLGTVNKKIFYKNYSAVSDVAEKLVFEGEEPHKMAAWEIHSYGGLEELQLSRSVRIPALMSPNDVLVKVSAASVNPIDVAMMGSYGHVLLNTIRQVEKCSANEMEFPLILGRDFAGEVVAKGNSVSSELMVGDSVFGVSPPHKPGCHAQYVIVHKDWVHRKPEKLKDSEASCLLYAGLTAWSALKITGELMVLSPQGRSVLVLGASGGVGSLAVQMLNAWGAQVVATCSTDAVPLVQSLGAQHVIDYTNPSALDAIKAAGKFDVILDAAGLPEDEFPKYLPLLKEWRLAKYITLRSPLLRNTDQLGLVGGMLRNAADLVVPNLTTGALLRGTSLRWGYFAPINAGVREISRLAESGQLMPIIDTTMNILELPAAYDRVSKGHLRGKVVVTV